MSRQTIAAYTAAKAKQDVEDRALNVLGCTCHKCGLTWIVCVGKLNIGRIAHLTGRHEYCPSCREPKPLFATAAQIRSLIGDMA